MGTRSHGDRTADLLIEVGTNWLPGGRQQRAPIPIFLSPKDHHIPPPSPRRTSSATGSRRRLLQDGISGQLIQVVVRPIPNCRWLEI
jgi:hypothetical protein